MNNVNNHYTTSYELEKYRQVQHFVTKDPHVDILFSGCIQYLESEYIKSFPSVQKKN